VLLRSGVVTGLGAPGIRTASRGVPPGEDNRRENVRRAGWNKQVIAESDATIVVEGNHWFAPDAGCKEPLALP